MIEMLEKNIDYFKTKPLNSPKITILLDHGYHPEKLTTELEKIYPEITTKIRFELFVLFVSLRVKMGKSF